MIRIIVQPHRSKPGRAVAYREGFPDEVLAHGQDLLSKAARKLLMNGERVAETITMRWHDKDYDSFAPRNIVEVAKYSYSESDKQGIRKQLWRPFNDTPRTREEERLWLILEIAR